MLGYCSGSIAFSPVSAALRSVTVDSDRCLGRTTRGGKAAWSSGGGVTLEFAVSLVEYVELVQAAACICLIGCRECVLFLKYLILSLFLLVQTERCLSSPKRCLRAAHWRSSEEKSQSPAFPGFEHPGLLTLHGRMLRPSSGYPELVLLKITQHWCEFGSYRIHFKLLYSPCLLEISVKSDQMFICTYIKHTTSI